LSITDPLVNLPGITAGPDRAIWFTVSSTGENTEHFIGRMPTDGNNYRLWPLPDESLYPGRIVTGPDDALWFTTAHGIGRITVDGEITEHPMPDGSTPVDIAVGTDRALWFSTNRGNIGQVTASGEITLHPLDGTTRLIGIAAAPDGTLWVADGENDKLWHYAPNS
jgi:virginiamycin B lyase